MAAPQRDGKNDQTKRNLQMNKMSQIFVFVVTLICAAMAPAAFASEGAAPSVAEQQALAAVNINTADADELAQTLNGVGARKALAIIEYREQFGPFKTAEELTDVKGIGDAIVKRNADRIVVE